MYPLYSLTHIIIIVYSYFSHSFHYVLLKVQIQYKSNIFNATKVYRNTIKLTKVIQFLKKKSSIQRREICKNHGLPSIAYHRVLPQKSRTMTSQREHTALLASQISMESALNIADLAAVNTTLLIENFILKGESVTN